MEQARRMIGKRIREARLSAGLTQEDVATDFRCSRQAVSSWENGKTLPTLLEFKQLVILYAVSSDKLLSGVEDSEAEGQRLLERMLQAKVSARTASPVSPGPL